MVAVAGVDGQQRQEWKAVKRSNLKSVPDELSIPDGSSGRVKLFNTGVLQCFCPRCKCEFWVKSNAVNVCPTCIKPGVQMVWTTPVVAFVPQREDEVDDE